MSGFVKEIGTSIHSVGTVTTQPIPITAAPGAGHLIILHIVQSNYGISSVTDSKGNTWTKAASKVQGITTSQWFTTQDVGTLTTSDTVTVTFAGAVGNIAAKLAEFSGNVAAPLDQTTTASFTTTTARGAGTTPATVQANELVIATFGFNAGETAFTPGSGYSVPTTPYLNNANSSICVESEFQVISATGAQTPTATGGASVTGAGVAATYRLSSGSVVPTVVVAATSVVSGVTRAIRKIAGGLINATSMVGGTIRKPGTPTIASTYGAGTYGSAVFGGSGAPPPTGIVGVVAATSVMGGAISRKTALGPGGIYTPLYSPPIPPTPPPVPVVGNFAKAVYAQLNLGQLIGDDHDFTLNFLGAIGRAFDQMDDLAHADANGNPQWSSLLDIDKVPDEGLAWLGQFTGTIVDPSLTYNQQRQQIRDRLGWQRGTPEVLQSAVRSLLTGTQTVELIERDTSPYHFTIATYGDETPDQTLVLLTIQKMKPAGLQFTYSLIGGSPATADTYENVFINYATYQELYDDNQTYQDLYLNP